MTEVPTQTQSLAQQIGLVDGEFLVQRSAPEGVEPAVEQGWQVAAVYEVPVNGNPDESITKVDIVLPGPTEKTTLIKSGVPLERLRSWQPQPEADGLDDDTIPREQLVAMGATPVEQVVDEPTPIEGSPQAVEELSGSDEPTSVAAGADEAGVPTDAVDAPVADAVSEREDAEQVPNEFEPKPQVVTDIAERLGLPSDSEPSLVEQKLTEQIEGLDLLTRSLSELNQNTPRTVHEINATLAERRNHLTGHSRNAIQYFLDRGYPQMREIVRDEKKIASLPQPLRSRMMDSRRQIANFGDDAYIMMGGNMPRNLTGAFDDGPAPQVSRTLLLLRDTERDAASALLTAEQELAELVGYRRAHQEYESRQAERAKDTDVFGVLARAEKTSTKAVRVKNELREEFSAALGNIVVAKPDQEQLEEAVERARQLVESGQAEATLAGMSFMAEPDYDSELVTERYPAIWLEEPIYVDPMSIDGAEGFDSWMGRGEQGRDSVARREGPSGTRRSIDQIKDYATRDTPIPELSAEGGIRMIVANNRTIVMSENAHRAAAARLRGEPVPVTAFEIIKYDGDI